MVDRIKCAVEARQDPSFVIMARTDAFASEGTANPRIWFRRHLFMLLTVVF